jgi:hypothetical protein
MDGLRLTALFLIFMNGSDFVFLIVVARDALHDREFPEMADHEKIR